MDESLAQFQSELEHVGLRVVPHRSHLCVRLPLFASVRARVQHGELRLDLQAGPVGPARALAWTAIVATIAVVVVGRITGVGVATVATAFGGIALLILELAQLIVGEACATRLAVRWAALQAGRGARAAGSEWGVGGRESGVGSRE